MRSTFTPLAVISSPSMRIRPASIGSMRLMQRRSVDLPLPDAPMSATTSCSATSRSMPRSTSSSPNDLWSPWIDSAGTSEDAPASRAPRPTSGVDGVADETGTSLIPPRPCHACPAAPSPACRRRPRAGLLAGEQPVGEPGERDRDHEEDQRRRDVGREVERGRWRICVSRKTSTTPIDDTSTVSFWRPMKSLSSGGTTRRTACGSTTNRSALPARQAERPRGRLLARVDRVDARPVDLGHVGRVHEGQRDHRPEELVLGHPRDAQRRDPEAEQRR